MILQALAKYYERIPNVANEGFQKHPISFVVVLKKNGHFAGLQDVREGDGKKKSGQLRLVPRAVKRSNNLAANLLWDNSAYVFGRVRPDKKHSAKLAERAEKQRMLFLARIKSAFSGTRRDDGVTAVVRFLETAEYEKIFGHPLWSEIEESGGNISFQLEGDTELVCQRDEVRNAITSAGTSQCPSETQTCLVTGLQDVPTILHTAIKGVWGAQSSGANIVSFNCKAFSSFGKSQGQNAPVGEKTEFAYTTALNTLLAKGSSQRIQVGDSSTVFWAEREHEIEDWFADIFGEPSKGDSGQDNSAIGALLVSPKTGAETVLDDETKFYVLGLSPNAGRIAVRFWYGGTVGGVEQHLKQYFNDISIEHGPAQPKFLSLFRLLVSTAKQGESKNIQSNLAGDFMKAILAGTPYPRTLLSAVVRRIRAEREVTYAQASLAKAVLVRNARYYLQEEKKEVGMALDLSNKNIGYRLGCLFAVLEKVQEEANPGINATIKDRFYGSASSTPVIAFPHLLKLKNHHVAKLENKGRAVNIEKIIGEIVDDITDFPSHLSLDDQGRFAVGYYHRRQEFFKKRETDE